MTHKLLKDTGEALYGPQWQSAMARDLDVTDRTIRRWFAGDQDPPPGIWIDLMRITQDRVMQLDAMMERMKQAASP